MKPNQSWNPFHMSCQDQQRKPYNLTPIIAFWHYNFTYTGCSKMHKGAKRNIKSLNVINKESPDIQVGLLVQDTLL